MYNFDRLYGHVLPDSSPEKISPEIVRAFIHGKEALLRDESEAWLRANLAKFAAMAAQLRSEAVKRDEDACQRLELALRFDELAAHSLPEVRDEDGLPC
jgi:hypothetical protein